MFINKFKKFLTCKKFVLENIFHSEKVSKLFYVIVAFLAEPKKKTFVEVLRNPIGIFHIKFTTKKKPSRNKWKLGILKFVSLFYAIKLRDGGIIQFTYLDNLLIANFFKSTELIVLSVF